MSISVRGLRKRYGKTLALDSVSFEVRPGSITGFLGPNGSGKSTTMRAIVGLDRPTSGIATVHGVPYARLRAPLRRVGTLLEAGAAHPARSARNHLRWVAATHGIGRSRIDEVLDITGLTSAATRRVGGYSLGMTQRLGIAVALLGDPETLILDEPVNGLDPDGVAWVRTLLRHLADEGRTVFLSSHLLGELSLIAEHIIVIGRGRILADAPLSEFVTVEPGVRVRSPELARLLPLLAEAGGRVRSPHGDSAEVTELSIDRIVAIAAAAGLPLTEVGLIRQSLEAAYVELTRDDLEYGGTGV